MKCLEILIGVIALCGMSAVQPWKLNRKFTWDIDECRLRLLCCERDIRYVFRRGNGETWACWTGIIGYDGVEWENSNKDEVLRFLNKLCGLDEDELVNLG